MSGLMAEDQLANCQPVVLILRIVLNRNSEVQYGELLDAHANRVAFVRELTDLPYAVTRWLEQPLTEGVLNLGERKSRKRSRGPLAIDDMR